MYAQGIKEVLTQLYVEFQVLVWIWSIRTRRQRETLQGLDTDEHHVIG